MGTSVCPLCPVLLAGRGLLIPSEDAEVLLWRGLCCSAEAQDGEEAEEEEEEERGRSGGEAGGPVEFIFSIMVVVSGEIPVSAKLLFLSAAQRVCRECVSVCLVLVLSLYVCESN